MRLLAALAFFPMAAFAVTAPPLPPSGFADTEVSTNLAFSVDLAVMSRIEFTVALDATPTNSVEIAIGTDADGDGCLSVEESAQVFGYDCGAWFWRDMGENRSEAVAAGTSLRQGLRLSRTFILKRRKLDVAWDLIKVTRRGCGASCELAKADGLAYGLVLEVR